MEGKSRFENLRVDVTHGLAAEVKLYKPPHIFLTSWEWEWVAFGVQLIFHSWIRADVRSVLQRRKRSGRLLSGPKLLFLAVITFGFYLDIKVTDSRGRVARHKIRAAGRPAGSFHSSPKSEQLFAGAFYVTLWIPLLSSWDCDCIFQQDFVLVTLSKVLLSALKPMTLLCLARLTRTPKRIYGVFVKSKTGDTRLVYNQQ